jgi:hypothetical protein
MGSNAKFTDTETKAMATPLFAEFVNQYLELESYKCVSLLNSRMAR